jgi:hypothetical protein
MEAALAELGLEDLTKEAEDDKDFFVEKGEPSNLSRLIEILFGIVLTVGRLCRRRRYLRIRL